MGFALAVVSMFGLVACSDGESVGLNLGAPTGNDFGQGSDQGTDDVLGDSGSGPIADTGTGSGGADTGTGSGGADTGTGSGGCPDDPDQCGCNHSPYTCQDLSGACGTQSDGCGGLLECGCPVGQSCNSSGWCVENQIPSTGAPIGSTVTIHTFDSNGGYIWADPNSGNVAANLQSAADWGRFVVESGSSDRPGTVAFKNVSSGQYLTCRCGAGDTGEIKADVPHKFAWESFVWNDLGSGQFSLTADNGKVVWAAIDKPNSPVAAYSWSTDVNGIWAKWTYAPAGAVSGFFEWGSETAHLPAAPAGYQWHLNPTFTDEFKSWDGTKWQARLDWWDGTGEGRPGAYVSGQNAWDTPNVDVKDSKLMIYTKANGPSAEKWLGTGVVSSKTKAPQGYYEVRMKASAISTTSAFWFQDPNVAKSEIDVIEAIGGVKNQTYSSFSTNLHSNFHYFPNGFGGSGYAQQPSITTSSIPGSTTSWHTYGVWWRNAHEALIYLDGQHVSNFNYYGSFPNNWDRLSFAGNFDQDMTMIFDSEVWDWEWQTKPGTAPGLPTVAEVSVTDDSNAVQFDWVRGYRLVPNGQSPAPIGTTINIHTASAIGGYIWADPNSGIVAANSPTPGDWGKFVVEGGSADRPGTVAFKHVSSGKYLTCRCGASDTFEIKADVSHKFAWESFAWNDLGAGQFSLTADNGNVVYTSLNLGNKPVFAYSWSTNPADAWAALTYSTPGD
jgi:hypothetical protein